MGKFLKHIILQKALLIVMLFISFSQYGVSQTTKVSGKIIDAVSREPLPFVNIIFKGTTVGATSDIEGHFDFSTVLKVDSVVVSYVGYNKLTKAIRKGAAQEVIIALSQGVDLNVVEVHPGENPAWRILRKVIANKDKNDRKKLDAYQYEVYNKVEFDLNNLSDDFKNNKLLKPFSFIFDNIDSTNAKEKPYLPIFMTEALSEYYFRKNPRTHNEIIKANRVAGVENASVSQFMGDMYQNINIYDNNMAKLLSTVFIILG